MNDLLKKGFLIGLGAAVASKEKVEKYLNDLVSKGKLTPSEADELFDTLIKKGEETEKRWTDRKNEKMQSLFSDLQIVTQQEFTELKTQVEELEFKVAELSFLSKKQEDNDKNNTNE